MADDNESSSGEEPNTQAPVIAPRSEASDSVSQFLKLLPEFVDPNTAKASLRATPHGIFVEKTFLPSFFAFYQKWFKEKLGRETGLSEQKCLKKFFNTPSPPLYYLIEAKQCMIGHLVRREYSDPQRLGLPYYLGSVDDTRRMLHPRDPMLMYMSNLEAKQGIDGREFVLNTSKGKWSFSERILSEFAKLLQRSPNLSKQFPDYSGALRDSFKALAAVLEKARLAAPKQRLLVPVAFRNRQELNYIAMGGLTFVVEGKSRIIALYEVGGRTLFRFIKREFAQLHSISDRRHRGPVEILPIRSRELALLHLKGRAYSLHPRGFIEFIRGVMHASVEGTALEGRYSVKDCLDEFYRAFQLAESIDKNKVARHLGGIRTTHPHCLITSRWIFVATPRGRIISCVDRFHSGPHNHSTPSRGPRRSSGRPNRRSAQHQRNSRRTPRPSM